MNLKIEVEKALSRIPDPTDYNGWAQREQDLEDVMQYLRHQKRAAGESKLGAGQAEHGELEYHLQLLSRGGYLADSSVLRALATAKLARSQDDYTLPVVSDFPELLTARFILKTETGPGLNAEKTMRVEVYLNSPLAPYRQGCASTKFRIKGDEVEVRAVIEKSLTKAVARASANLLKLTASTSPR
jgi:hypothetical protein